MGRGIEVNLNEVKKQRLREYAQLHNIRMAPFLARLFNLYDRDPAACEAFFARLLFKPTDQSRSPER